MPITLPRVTDQSVDLRPLQGAMQSGAAATPDAFGGAAARQLGQAAQLATAVAQRQQDREDADNLLRADADIKDAWLTKRTELLNRHGVDAKGASDEAGEWFKSNAGRLRQGLTSDRQRQAFDKSLTALQLSARDLMLRHESQERDKSLVDAANARIAASTNLAIGDPTPQNVETARKEIAATVAAIGASAGNAPETVAAKTLDALTVLHKSIVSGMADRSPDAAKAYYYTHKDEIAADHRREIEKTLEKSGQLSIAQRAADEIMRRNLPLDQAMQLIEREHDGEQERMLKAEVASRYSYAEAARRDAEQQSYGTALLEVEQKGRVSAATWSRLTDAHRAAVLNRQQAEAKARRLEAEGRPVKTDWTLYLELRQQAVEQPEAFAALDLRQYVDRIGGAQLEQLVDLKTKAAKPEKGLRDAVTLSQQMNATMQALKIRKPEARGQFLSFVQSAVDDAQQAKGKPLNYDERQKIIDEAVLQGPNPDALWGQKRAFELTPEQRSRFKPNAATDAPATEIEALNDALKAQGLQPTPENRLALYNRAMGKAR